ncbi:MAG: type II toxin-antitoxin system HicA family toxin [Chloroflexota bacterium]|nr:type II toxin-antitoxin system HicA family toxin [Chloroflexota bacterium]
MRPISRRELIRKFRALGFEGPISGGRHGFMQRGKLKVHIPGEHGADISIALQREILRQAEITAEEWEQA